MEDSDQIKPREQSVSGVGELPVILKKATLRFVDEDSDDIFILVTFLAVHRFHPASLHSTR